MRHVRSLLNLLWVSVREMAACASALIRCDFEAAAGHARHAAVSVQNDLLLIIAAIQRRVPLWPKPGPHIRRILIVKLDRIGDMVTTTPVFDALRARFPGARLDIVGDPSALALLEDDPRIGDRLAYRSWLYHPVRVFPPRWREWFVPFKLLFRRYPLVVYLRGSFPFLLLGVTSRLAATKFIVAEPVILRYMKALEALLGPVVRADPRLHVSSAAARFADEILSVPDRGCGPRVTIHAAASTATKVWPPERFAALADELTDRFGGNVHFLAGPAEQAGLDAIARLARHAHSYHCTLRLPQTVAVIAASDLFIGNDSGLSHIAAAVGTRLIVLWGPANLSMARPRASAADCTILYHDIPCRNQCLEFRCHNPVALECLTRTQVSDVVTVAERLLDGKARPTASRRVGPVSAAVATEPGQVSAHTTTRLDDATG